ncbi:MAG: PDZ domain-containing protein, partial [Patescibacteria group bacterium]
PEFAQDNNLQSQKGALVVSGDTQTAITPGSPAEKAGILEGDIVLEINAIKLEGKNTLLSVVQRYKPGQKIGLRVLRGCKIIIRYAILDEFK